MARAEFKATTRKEALKRGGQPTHGMSNTPEYRAWINMRTRCYGVNSPQYPRWGGRGIEVCDRWLGSFEAFLEDVGKRPTPRHSLDRINVDGHYEPGNVRWATRTAQSRNLRCNHNVVLNGINMTLAEAADMASVPYNTVLYRLKRGWKIEDAVSFPPRNGYRPHA